MQNAAILITFALYANAVSNPLVLRDRFGQPALPKERRNDVAGGAREEQEHPRMVPVIARERHYSY